VLLEHGEEEIVLAGEVRVDRALRIARLVGDLVETGGMETTAEEDAARRRDQVLAGLLLTLGAAEARCGGHRIPSGS
jgi:hypothetical protein